VRIRPALLLSLAALLVAVPTLSACGAENASAPATTSGSPPTTTSTAEPLTEVTGYRVENGVVVPHTLRVAHTEAVAGAALAALAPGARVAIAGGTATVDVTDATEDLTAEIVYTLTQFPTVQRVDVAGRTGLTRDDLVGYAPIILVDSPAADADVPATFTVSGSAEVFEATLVVELVRDGKVIETQNVTASMGAPGRGTFATTLHAPSAGGATVVAFAPSAEDGSPQHQVEVPITVTP
jgi:hypothetical protein